MLFALALTACGGSTTGGDGGDDSSAPPDDAGVDQGSADTSPDASSDSNVADGTFDVAVDTTPPPDATVRRLPCLDGSKLAGDLPLDQYGALEAEVVSIVPPGTKGCPEDDAHLHLQVDVAGKRYDVAMTFDDTTGGQPMGIFTKDVAASTQPEGWSDANFDFVTDLGAHSTSFTLLAPADMLTRLVSELTPVSFVTIHGRSYTDGTGIHDIHRNGGDHDGVVLAHGLGAGGGDHAIAVRFYSDVF